MSQMPGQHAGANNAYAYQHSANQPEAEFSSKQILDAYIYDFLLKSSLKNSASTFCREAGILDAAGEAPTPSVLDRVKDAPQGFLYEWWQIFWDLFNARTHKEGSAMAREFSKILTNKQKQEYAYRSQAVQAARLQQMAGLHGERLRDQSEPFPIPSLPQATDYATNACHPNPSPYPRSEPMQAPFQTPVASHTQQFVPPFVGANIPGWPVYPNQSSSHYTSSSTARHVAYPNVHTNHTNHADHTNQYHINGPVPSSSPQFVTSRTKQNRPSSGKKKKHNLTETPNTPDHPTMNTKGPLSSFSGKISGIEGLHNYQRQLIMSEIEYNNQNKKNSPSSGASFGAGCKKHMLPPSAAISPHTISPASTVGVSNMNMVSNSKPKVTRRRSANQVLGPVNRSMQNSSSESPCTPVNPAGSVNGGDINEKSVSTSSLTSVAELGKPSFNNSQESLAKKSNKKVRKPKKIQSITFNNNNFNFINSNSVPTPPNESQPRPPTRTTHKTQKKPTSARSNNKTIKYATEASPQLLADDTSITTPTFINTVWNSNGKVQTTPHGNFTFVEDSSAQSSAAGFTNVESVAGSSSGASYQYGETEPQDLLSINTILPLPESTAPKNEVPSGDVIAPNEGETTANESHNQDFNLDLLEPSEHSFNFLSWRQ